MKCFKYSYGEVKNKFEDKNLSLVSLEYKNSLTHLEYRCNIHPDTLQRTTLANLISKNNTCKECNLSLRRKSTQDIKDVFDKYGYELLEKNYINAHQKLSFVCKKHTNLGVQTTTYMQLKAGSRACNNCIKEENILLKPYNRIDIKEVILLFKNNNLEPLFDTYINSKILLPFKCNIHPDAGVQHISYKNLSRGCVSKCCASSLNCWKENSDNIKKRDIKGYKAWREIIKRKQGVCVKCGSSENIEVHHVFNYSVYSSLRTDVNNGVCLCKNCHKIFHKLNGQQDNNTVQLLKFLSIFKKCRNCNSLHSIEDNYCDICGNSLDDFEAVPQNLSTQFRG